MPLQTKAAELPTSASSSLSAGHGEYWGPGMALAVVVARTAEIKHGTRNRIISDPQGASTRAGACLSNMISRALGDNDCNGGL